MVNHERPNLLAITTHLRSRLASAFPLPDPGSSLPHHHPLSTVSPREVSDLRRQSQETFATLRASLETFHSILPKPVTQNDDTSLPLRPTETVSTTVDYSSTTAPDPASSTGQSPRAGTTLTPAGAGPVSLDKFLSLLNQFSTTQHTLSSLASAASTPSPSSSSSSSALATGGTYGRDLRAKTRRRRYPTLHPDEIASYPSLGEDAPERKQGQGLRREGVVRDRPERRREQIVLRILERLAKNLGLVSFRDDDHERENDDPAQVGFESETPMMDSGTQGIGAAGETVSRKKRKVITLSLGGKVMVVDFKIVQETTTTMEFRGGGENGPRVPTCTVTSREEWIDSGEEDQSHGIKVAYVWKGEQYFHERSAQHLSSLFTDYRQRERARELVATEEDERAQEEELWTNVANVLRELHELDERTSREEVDYFGKLTALVDRVEGEFPRLSSISQSPDVASSPILLPNRSSLYPLFLIDLSPSAKLAPSTSQYLTTLSSKVLLDRFLRCPGVYAVEFGFSDILLGSPGLGTRKTDNGAAGANLRGTRDAEEWYRIRVVSSSTAYDEEGVDGVEEGEIKVGIPITKGIGRRIWEQLHETIPGNISDGTNAQVAKLNAEVNLERALKPRRTTTMTDLIASLSSWSEALSSSSFRASDPITTSTRSLSTHTISFEPSPASTLPHSFKFQLAPSRCASRTPTFPSQGNAAEEAFLLDNLWVRGHVDTDRSGGVRNDESQGLAGMKRLRNGIEILKEQIRMNDLVLSVINPMTKDDPEGGRGPGELIDHDLQRKKRKLDHQGDGPSLEQERGLNLDDLFNNQLNATALPVFVHVDAVSSTDPAILLSFPSPHLPPPEARPMSIEITSCRTPSTGYGIKLETYLEDEGTARLRSELEERGSKILELTRDLSILMKWVVKTLGALK